MVKDMISANVSCVEDYRDWRNIGFGLADKFGEDGRHYFHTLSSCSSKYDTEICNKQYDNSLKRNGRTGNKISISTIYWYAKQAGISVISDKTKKIASLTSSQKKSGVASVDVIANNLEKFAGIKKEDSKDIISQTLLSNTSHTDNDSIVENIRLWVKSNYDLKRNIITRKLESSGKILDEIDLNTMFLDCKIIFETLNFDLFCKVLFSKNTPQYNPLTDWFEERQENKPTGIIDSFFKSFNTNGDDIIYFGKKWLVSIISSVYGIHSPLMLIFAGERQGSGKTEAFRRLLPRGLMATPQNYLKYFQEVTGSVTDKDEFLDYIEIKATRDLIIYNSGITNETYKIKVGEKSRGMTGERILIDKTYFDHSTATMKRISGLIRKDTEKTFKNID